MSKRNSSHRVYFFLKRLTCPRSKTTHRIVRLTKHCSNRFTAPEFGTYLFSNINNKLLNYYGKKRYVRYTRPYP
jgi:hypothetical protein